MAYWIKLQHTQKKKCIVSALKKIKADVIYAHFWENALPVYEYCSCKDIPLFVACGEGNNDFIYTSFPDKKRQHLSETVTGVISVSTENKRKSIIKNLAKEDKIIVIPNCVDTDIFFPNRNESLKSSLGISKDDFVVCFVGSFIERKGSKRLSEAIKLLNDKSIKTIFIGQPQEGDVAIPDCEGIVFIGKKDHSEIPKLLNCSDVFVLPTLNEGCCNAIVEALACGIPVISSSESFNDDILNNRNSIRIDSSNVSEIANAISKMRLNKSIRAKLEEYVMKNNPYSLDTRAERIIEFMQTQI